MKILIIEDDRSMLHFISRQAAALGHEIQEAENGQAAISSLLEFAPDLVLCDVVMPGLSGFSTVSLLRSIYLWKKPIILMSAAKHPLMFTHALDSGANTFLHKPFTSAELEQRIQQVLERNRA